MKPYVTNLLKKATFGLLCVSYVAMSKPWKTNEEICFATTQVMSSVFPPHPDVTVGDGD